MIEHILIQHRHICKYIHLKPFDHRKFASQCIDFQNYHAERIKFVLWNLFLLSPTFKAILPKKVQVGDEIILKGKINDDAKVFFVNFVCDYYDDIAYHFKTNFTSNTVVQNHKTGGAWKKEITNANTWISGLSDEFTLTFHFGATEILVYTGTVQTHSLWVGLIFAHA